MSETIDTSRLTLLLNDLRLPAIKHLWPQFTERSDKEGWPAARLLMSLAEHEVAERDRRRIERHLGEAKLLPEKTLDNFDFAAAYSAEADRLFRRNVTGYSAESALAVFSTLTGHDRSRFRALRWS
jgi:DNA replication protein DnaC